MKRLKRSWTLVRALWGCIVDPDATVVISPHDFDRPIRVVVNGEPYKAASPTSSQAKQALITSFDVRLDDLNRKQMTRGHGRVTQAKKATKVQEAQHGGS